MSKAVKSDFEFNKEVFADALKIAIGSRTQVAFSKDSGLSPAYINKYLRMSFDKAPIPDTIKKIASASQGTYTFEDLLTIAGYNPERFTDNNIYKKTIRDEFSNNIKEVLASKGVYLLEKEDTGSKFYSPALKFSVENAPFEEWHMIFFPQLKGEAKENEIKIQMDYIYGVLSTYESTKKAKATIITNSMKIFRYLTKNAPTYLSMYVTILLVEDDTNTPFIERLVPSALPEDETIENYNIVNE